MDTNTRQCEQNAQWRLLPSRSGLRGVAVRAFRLRIAIGSLALAALLAACSGGVSTTNTSNSVTASQYTVGGSVSGLSGTGLTLQNNGGDTLTVGSNGAFTFPTPLISGDSYSVAVMSQPITPNQTCVATTNTGTVGDSNVTTVVITCANKSTTASAVVMDTIGGTAVGVMGSGLVLQNDGGDNLSVPANGPFTFKASLPQGLPYAVSVLSPPINPYQDCAISGGSGTTGISDINNIQVSCTTNSNPTFTIGGTVSGVSSAGSIVLEDNGRDDLPITTDGPFTFAIAVPSGSSYSVTSASIGGQQSQTCAFANASGIVASSNVTNVKVTCRANVAVSVAVSGLLGSGLVLQDMLPDKSADNLTVTRNGTAQFATALPSGSSYSIVVATQPQTPTQTCTVTNGTGVAQAGQTTSIAVSCKTDPFSLGGTVTGLSGTLVLQLNGANDLPVTGNGPFTFPSLLPSGTPYTVAVLSFAGQPIETCTVANGTGTVGASSVSNVAITCAVNSFAVGGTISGLTGSGLVLQDNGNNLAVAQGSTSFAFTPVENGTPYSVTITSQPSGYACAVANGSGTVPNAAVTNVSVSCSQIGGFLYVTNGGGGNISGFAIDANSGTLQPLTQIVATPPADNAIVATTGNNPRSIIPGCEVTDTANSLYVANAGSSSISAFTANLSTAAVNGVGPGAVTLIATTPPATNPTSTLPVASPSFLDFVQYSFRNNYECQLLALGSYQAPATTNALPLDAAQSGTLTAGPAFTTETNPVAAANTYFNDAETYVEYIADQVTGDVNEFRYFAGVLEPITPPNGPVSDGAGSKPDAVLATQYPGPYYVYVANFGTGTAPGTISEYEADNTAGYLSAISEYYTDQPIVAATGDGPSALAQATVTTNLNGNFVTSTYVYVANFNDATIDAYSVSPGTADYSYVPGQLVPLAPMASTPTGQMPVAMTVATLPNPDYPASSNYVGISYLYAVNSGSNSVTAYSISPTNGSLTPLPMNSFAVGLTPTSATTVEPFTVGGTISGLTAPGLVLQDNNSYNLSVASGSTTFTIATAAIGTPYDVTVLTSPTGETCMVSNGTGTVGVGNVTTVNITCGNNTPEIDPRSAIGALALLLGALVVLRSRVAE